MTPLYEQVRPQTLGEIVGQPKAVSAARALLDGGIGGKSVWIDGPSGAGKTTIARILAASIADPFCVEECTARTLDVGAIESAMRLYGWGKGGRVWIVNEAQGLSRGNIERLLDLCERLPAHCAIIFTTTHDGQERLFEEQIDAGPLLSRMRRITLTNQGFARPAAELCRAVAQARNLDGQPIEAYVKLMQRCKNNLRAALQEIESGTMKGGAE